MAAFLAQHDRLDLLKEILASARLEFEKRNGQQRVQVVSAKPLDEGTLARVKDRVAAAFGFEPIIEPQTDSSLIGGVVIRVGNSVYDGSLRSWLKQLAKNYKECFIKGRTSRLRRYYFQRISSYKLGSSLISFADRTNRSLEHFTDTLFTYSPLTLTSSLEDRHMMS